MLVFFFIRNYSAERGTSAIVSGAIANGSPVPGTGKPSAIKSKTHSSEFFNSLYNPINWVLNLLDDGCIHRFFVTAY